MDGRAQDLPVRIAFDGVPQVSETRVTAIGPHALTLETAVPTPGVALTLISSYIGMRATETQVTHVAAAAGDMTWSAHRSATAEALPVWTARQRCLFDHLAEAHELLSTFGVSATVEVGDALPVALLD